MADKNKKQPVDELKNKLTPEQYNICFLKGTEPPFSGKYTDNFDRGIYQCVVCNTPLFIPIPNSTPIPAGQALTMSLKKEMLN
ncbi:hypothetical protein A3I53_04500 [Candidatus Curtissbacteria bacterium RIFCSPLOWO2_02_FULL_40_13b]|uniref:peptide-methionine (R)-S-oxide reductase n=1 Tax=Candidatus Curtissbacteria bacterium RIFCSPLOWO2_02_FULL_40_13b TaxID=1797733 RepID=A0A1F5HVR1_9BACT|nr:MAG: hypothetical protein A3I53_04500 [Candidatus Curtissbacteria bacterium RIFCSPLOWO2_02_FULL_40_13b]